MKSLSAAAQEMQILAGFALLLRGTADWLHVSSKAIPGALLNLLLVCTNDTAVRRGKLVGTCILSELRQLPRTVFARCKPVCFR